MSHTRFLTFAVLSSALLLLSACGGGGDDEESSTSSVPVQVPTTQPVPPFPAASGAGG